MSKEDDIGEEGHVMGDRHQSVEEGGEDVERFGGVNHHVISAKVSSHACC